MDSLTVHVPVLLHEAIDGLAIQSGDIVVDATTGGGGHSEEILKQSIRLICLDADSAALDQFRNGGFSPAFVIRVGEADLGANFDPVGRALDHWREV